jgi:hypothetical protein
MAGWALLAAPLAAAPPPAKDADELAKTIDRLVAARWAENGVKAAPVADDAEFVRRAYLDLAGRIPSVAEVRAFLADVSPDKRQKLIADLLSGPAYINNFGNIWRTLLLPEDNPANFQLRFYVPSFEAWLRKQFADNVPYDQMVRELLTAKVASDGRGPRELLRAGGQGETTPMAFYMAKDAKPEELAAATSRLFLGVRLECAQCHNHPFGKWSRQQFWEYAAFFAGIQKQGEGFFVPIRELNDRREIAIPNTSQVVQAAFLDGAEPQWKYKVGPRVTLAEWLTAKENPFFARATVNRVWGHFFGTGIVEPIDDFNDENKPSHPELLDELAKQFAAHDFDLKYVIRAITLSETYQLTSARTDPTQDEPHLYARMPVKGLTPEQLFDSLSLATGYREARLPTGPFVINANTPRAEFLAKFATQDKRTESQTSILHALALMNGRFVADATSVERSEALAGVLDAPFLDTAGRIETLYLATLSRKPKSDELQRLVKYVEGGGPKKDPRAALADVFWALLNSSEFLLNH